MERPRVWLLAGASRWDTMESRWRGNAMLTARVPTWADGSYATANEGLLLRRADDRESTTPGWQCEVEEEGTSAVTGLWPGCPLCADDSIASGKGGVMQRRDVWVQCRYAGGLSEPVPHGEPNGMGGSRAFRSFPP